MLATLQQSLNDAAGRLDAIRTDLVIADAAMLGSSGVSKICLTTRATAYVWISATLEVFVKKNLSAILSEVNKAALPRQRIRLSLQSMLGHSSFAALQSVRGLNMWEERARALGQVDSSTYTPFNLAVLPIDGRTLRREHFDAIWQVFGFAPPSIPRPLCTFALSDLAEGRNQLAHGHISAEDFVRSKTTPQVLRILSLVEDVVEHLSLVSDSYITNAEYLR